MEASNSKAAPRCRLLRTIMTIALFTCCGMAYALLGTTLVSMEVLLDTDTTQISLAFSAHQIGYLVAAVICGVFSERINGELQFFTGCLIGGAALLAAPWFTSVVGFGVAIGFAGLGLGYSDQYCNVYLIKLWNNHRARDPIFQLLYLCFTIGSTITPLIAQPFLTDVPLMDNKNLTDDASAQENDVRFNNTHYNASEPQVANMISTFGNGTNDVSSVRYAFVVVGCLGLVVGLPFAALFCCLGPTFHDPDWAITQSKQDLAASQAKNAPTRLHPIGLFIYLFIFCFLLSITEMGPGDYLGLFVVEGFQWDVNSGAFIISLYWGAAAVGHLLAIPISYFLSEKNLLLASLLFTCIGHVLLVILPYIWESMIYVAVVLAGVPISTMLPSIILWMSDCTEAAGPITGISTAGYSVGLITFLPVIGSLLDNMGHMSLVYTLITALLVNIGLSMVVHFRLSTAPVKVHLEPNDVEITRL